MAKKTLIDLSADDTVSGNSTETSDDTPIAAGAVARILRFGGAVGKDDGDNDNIIALQWGSVGGGFKTVRAFPNFWDFKLFKEFEGDGTKHFRLVRQNNNTGSTQVIAWLEGIIL